MRLFRHRARRRPLVLLVVPVPLLIAVKPANAELRRLHIHNMFVVPMSASCPLHTSMSYMAALLVPAPRIKLTPQTIARGWTVIIASEPIGHNRVEQAFGRFHHHYVPRCVSSHGVGPGLGHWQPTKADYANYKKQTKQ